MRDSPTTKRPMSAAEFYAAGPATRPTTPEVNQSARRQAFWKARPPRPPGVSIYSEHIGLGYGPACDSCRLQETCPGLLAPADGFLPACHSEAWR